MSEVDRPHLVEVFTASATLTARYAGLLLTNRGAAGAVTLTLPAGQKGLRIRARKVTAQTFTLARAGSDTILNSAGGSVSSLAINVSAELQHDGTAWVVVDEAPGADGTIVAGQLADGAVTTAKILAANVTPPKMVFTGTKSIQFVGKAAAGAITITGLAVGDRVIAGWLSGDASDLNTKGNGGGGAGTGVCTTLAAFVAVFEAAVTVADQLQQTQAADLSDNVYTAILIPAAA